MKTSFKYLSIFSTVAIAATLHFGCSYNKDLLLTTSKTTIPVSSQTEREDCDTLVFTCIDYRFAFANQQFINEELELNNNYEHISIPGSIFNLVNPETREIVFSKITNLVNFRLIKKVVIIGHKDCGGYGGSSAFVSETTEHEYLSEDLRMARDILLEKYQGLRIHLYLESLTREGVHFEKII